MSCALLNCGLTCNGHETPEASAPACPYVGLADGLHALAQPLTVLRGALGAWKLRRAPEAASDKYLEMSAKQVERMSDLLGCMQDVLEAAAGEPKREQVDPSELLSIVLEGMRSTLREWGGKIERTESDVPIRFCGDSDRTERALRAALRAAVSVSSPGASIRLVTRMCKGQMEIVVEVSTVVGRSLNSTERLNVGLVETNILSQGGAYVCNEDPFHMTISLPANDGEGANAESRFNRRAFNPAF